MQQILAPGEQCRRLQRAARPEHDVPAGAVGNDGERRAPGAGTQHADAPNSAHAPLTIMESLPFVTLLYSLKWRRT